MGPLPQAMTADDSRPMNRKIAWTLRDADAPVRLDVAVAGNLDGINRSRARQLIEDGFVSVTGRAVRRGSSQVVCGDEVVVELTDDAGPRVDSPRAEFDVVFEDEHLIVVDKPAGVTVHPGPGHRGDTLIEGLIASRPELAAVGDPERPGIVHRLDKDTSGLLVIAKTDAALADLINAMKARAIVRTYTALVAGRINPDQGVVDAPIGRDPANRTRQAVVTSGKPARTRYRLLRPMPGASLIELVLETGRMHQIRVHMAAINHAVIGDRTYGRNFGPPGLERQFLHASRLKFVHPATGKTADVKSSLPDDLCAALAHYESG